MLDLNIRKQRGSGLILATILFMQCIVLMSTIAYRTTLTTSRTDNLLIANSIPLYGGAAETLAQALLLQDFYVNDVDTLSEDWAQPLQLPFGDGLLDGQVYDLQGCFNLNNLVASPIQEVLTDNTDTANNTNAANTNPESAAAPPDAEDQEALLAAYQTQLTTIVGGLLADTPTVRAADISNAIIDWMDDDTIETIPGGAEDVSYSRATNAYRTANARFGSLSELRLIQGVTPEVYAALTAIDDQNRRSLCVLPAHGTSLNVNFATAIVLSSLHDDFSLDDGETLLQAMPFESHNEFLEHELFDPEPEEANNSNSGFNSANTLADGTTSNPNDVDDNESQARKQPKVPTSVVSEYFLGRGTVTVSERTITMFTILQRDGQGQVTILNRSRGVF